MRISDWSSDVCSSDLLVAIEVGHIEGPDSDGAGTLFIPSSKTDREGAGAYAYLSPATMDAIARWREKAGIRKGPLLRRVETPFAGSVAAIGTARLHPNNNNPTPTRFHRAALATTHPGPLPEAAARP